MKEVDICREDLSRYCRMIRSRALQMSNGINEQAPGSYDMINRELVSLSKELDWVEEASKLYTSKRYHEFVSMVKANLPELSVRN